MFDTTVREDWDWDRPNLQPNHEHFVGGYRKDHYLIWVVYQVPKYAKEDKESWVVIPSPWPLKSASEAQWAHTATQPS